MSFFILSAAKTKAAASNLTLAGLVLIAGAFFLLSFSGWCDGAQNCTSPMRTLGMISLSLATIVFAVSAGAATLGAPSILGQKLRRRLAIASLFIALGAVIVDAFRLMPVWLDRGRAMTFLDEHAQVARWRCMSAVDLDHRQNLLLGGFYKLALACADGEKDIYVSCDAERCYIDMQ